MTGEEFNRVPQNDEWYGENEQRMMIRLVLQHKNKGTSGHVQSTKVGAFALSIYLNYRIHC